jgi:hypothetical protein
MYKELRSRSQKMWRVKIMKFRTTAESIDSIFIDSHIPFLGEGFYCAGWGYIETFTKVL